MTVTVFTAMLGDTDTVKAPTVVHPSVRYVCFTDRPSVVAPYEPVPVTGGADGVRLASRRLKIGADHPALGSPDVTLWHDAAFQLQCDPDALARSALRAHELVAFRHPHRTRIEDEAIAIARLGLLPSAVLTAQVQAYRAEGFRQQVITSTGFCLRRQTAAVALFNQAWWREVQRWGWRDQMSVDYALWRHPDVRVHYIEGHYRDNPHARWSLYRPKVVA